MIRKNRILFMVVMVVTALVFILSCAAPATQNTPDPSKQVDKSPIKIGFIGTFSKPWGAADKLTLEISIDELNKAGGINGRPVQLLSEDFKGEIPLGVAAYKKLVASEKCPVVLVETTDNVLANMEQGSQFFSEYPHVMFYTWAAGSEITQKIATNYNKYKHVFCLFSTTSMFLDPDFKFEAAIEKAAPGKRIALMLEDSTFGKEMQNGLPDRNLLPYKEALIKKGYTITHFGNNALGEKMFLPIFEQIAASKPEAIFWVTAYCDTITITKQWADSAAKDIDLVMGAGAVSMAAFNKITGGAAIGATGIAAEVDVPYTEKTVPYMRELVKRGGSIQMPVWGAYDFPWIYKAAVEKEKSGNIDQIIKAIESVEVQQVCWKWKFDPKYHEPKVGYPYFEYAWGQFQKDGKLVCVGSETLRKMTNPDKDYIPSKQLRQQP